MEELRIRRGAERDLPVINRLLYQVCKVHSDARPDLFKPGAKKYNDEELKEILADDSRPVFVAERDGEVLGYAFCISRQYVDNNHLTDIKTLYIDDICVEEAARRGHVGRALYEYVLAYAREQGFYNVTLNVWADNPDAVKFYEAMGMRIQKIGMEIILK